MAKWFRICASFEEEAEADREYWMRFSPEDRVALIDTMRAEWAELTGRPSPAHGHVEFLRSLNRHGVRALFIGPHALAFHAKPHYTEDLDLFVEASEENARRVAAALDDVRFDDRDFQVHITTRLAGVTFEEAWRNRVEVTYTGEQIFLIGAEELLRNKEASTRTGDRADLELLRHFVKSRPPK